MQADVDIQYQESEEEPSSDEPSDEYLSDSSPPDSSSNVTIERKREIVALSIEHPKWSWETLKRHGAKELNSRSALHSWKKQVERGENRITRYKLIDEYVTERLLEARSTFKIVRSSHLRQWAMQRLSEFQDPSFKFKASASWVTKFKRRHKVSSRKITRLVSKREVKSDEEIAVAAKNFQNEIQQLIPKFDPKYIFNTDQCGFQYELLSQRTLTFKGAKSVFGFSQSPTNLATHSYTVQYVINFEGEVLGNVFLCLQEKSGKLGPRVKQDVERFLPPNVTLTCSTSGKMSTSLTEYFLEKQVVPNVNDKFLWIVDSWTGHTNMQTYEKVFGHSGRPRCVVKIIPEKCTPLAQPLDTTFHRQLKYLAREVLAGLEVHVANPQVNPDDNWTTRKGVIKLQSLLHHQMSAPIFKPMIKYSWYSAGLTNNKVAFQNVKEVCFTFNSSDSLHCQLPGCRNDRFLKCARCRKLVCLHHFWIENHFYTCEFSP